eukprot:GGOE01009591.1.p1 GENE.GGOE01009591.1~~GGOE01009591.1.p1  ORF type:complete len:313 (-),score=96.42 GGOE01009591.1:1687-2601(-)
MNAVVPGVLSSVVTCTIFHPLELVETLLQTHAGISKDRVTGLSLTCRSVYRTSGIPGFYRGLEASAAGTMAFYGCYFHINHYLNNAYPSPALPAVAGKSWMAAAISSLATTPMLVWRTRSMVSSRPWPDFLQEVRQQGLRRTLYSGWVPNVLGTCSTALWFTTQHALTMQVSRGDPSTLTPTMSGALGTISTAISSSMTYPLSVLRTKQMVAGGCPSMAAAARDILHAGGPRGFYFGFSAYLLRSLPKGGTFFAIQKGVEDMLALPRCSIDISLKRLSQPAAPTVREAAAGLDLDDPPPILNIL